MILKSVKDEIKYLLMFIQKGSIQLNTPVSNNIIWGICCWRTINNKFFDQKFNFGIRQA